MQQIPKILIAEDEAIFVMSLERKLKTSGFFVCESAFSGKEAIDNFMRERPDLVILDLCLNCGINGIQVAHKIRSLSNIPILFITGFHIEEVSKEVVTIENSTILIKPFEPNDIIKAIKILLGNQLGNENHR